MSTTSYKHPDESAGSASPGARFFARIFDVSWETVVSVMIVTTAITLYEPGFADRMYTAGGGDLLLFMVCLLLAMVLDALVYRIFGNTPGKAWLGLRVRSAYGTRLGVGRYLKRNLLVWIKGLALGIPLVWLFTAANEHRRLASGRQASYDEALNTVVRGMPTSSPRRLAFGLVLGGIYLLNLTALFLGGDDGYYDWKNPQTQRTASINPAWGSSEQADIDGEQVYRFDERLGRAVVFLGLESITDDVTLEEYVSAFADANSDTMQFLASRQTASETGVPTWEGRGSIMNAGFENHLSVQIAKLGPDFWRIAAVQMVPRKEQTRTHVTELRQSLWATVLQ